MLGKGEKPSNYLLSTNLVYCYAGDYGRNFLRNGVERIVQREGFVIQALHYAL